MELRDQDQSGYTNGADTTGSHSVGDLGGLVCIYSRHADDENESQEKFLWGPGLEMPKYGYRLHYRCQTQSDPNNCGLLLTKARRTKSVAALMEPAMIKNLLTWMQRAGDAPGMVPAKVVQKAEIGAHCQMKTMTMEIVKAITKMAQYMTMRRN